MTFCMNLKCTTEVPWSFREDFLLWCQFCPLLLQLLCSRHIIFVKPLTHKIWPDNLKSYAADYKNEAEVGDALADAFQTGLVKREELFITTKASLIPVSLLLRSFVPYLLYLRVFRWLYGLYHMITQWCIHTYIFIVYRIFPKMTNK